MEADRKALAERLWCPECEAWVESYLDNRDIPRLPCGHHPHDTVSESTVRAAATALREEGPRDNPDDYPSLAEIATPDESGFDFFDSIEYGLCGHDDDSIPTEIVCSWLHGPEWRVLKHTVRSLYRHPHTEDESDD